MTKILAALIAFISCLPVDAQRINTASAKPAGGALRNTSRAYERIPPIWGEKPGGLRIEIRIANSAFLNAAQVFRENNVIEGTFLFVNAFHPASNGALTGYYDVSPIGEETALAFSRGGTYRSVRTENGYTVFRVTQYGDVPQTQRIGYSLNTAAWVQRSILRKGVTVNGNTDLNGVQVNTAFMGGTPLIISVSPGSLK